MPSTTFILVTVTIITDGFGFSSSLSQVMELGSLVLYISDGVRFSSSK